MDEAWGLPHQLYWASTLGYTTWSWPGYLQRCAIQYKSETFQYQIRRLISKPRDLPLKWSDCSEIWQAPRQHSCQGACQIPKRCDNSHSVNKTILQLVKLRNISDPSSKSRQHPLITNLYVNELCSILKTTNGTGCWRPTWHIHDNPYNHKQLKVCSIEFGQISQLKYFRKNYYGRVKKNMLWIEINGHTNLSDKLWPVEMNWTF